MLFRYTAITRQGKRIDGQIDASAREAVLAQLNTLGHFPVAVTAISGVSERLPGLRIRGVRFSDITLLTRELAMLLKAGQTLDQALTLLETDGGAPRVTQLVRRIRARLNEGMSLHEALASEPSAFPALYVSMVRAAEASGALDAALDRIADAREREQKLKSQILSAMLYPTILIVMAISAVLVMLAFVVPRFKAIIENTGAAAPPATRLVIGASDWLMANGAVAAVVFAVALAMIGILFRQPRVRQGIERALMRLPLTGHLMRLDLAIRFCRGLGIMIENGVALPAALVLCRDIVGYASAATAIDEAHQALRKGRSFAEPLAASGLFPPVVINLFRVGEETGGLGPAAHHAAQIFERKLDIAIQRLFTIIEPTIILLVSLFIAGIIISIIGAVMSINDLVI